MRFSDFLLVSDPADLDFIVGYADDQNIRIDVSDFFASNISGSGTPGYVPVFTSAQVIGDSVIFQHGSNIVIGGVNSLGYKLAVSGSLYASNGAVINSTISGADALRVIGGDGDIFVIPNDLGQPISSLRRINHPPAVLTTESATLGQLNSAISTLEGDIEILLDLKVDKTSVGVPNGVASLDAGGKVPLSQIPDSIIGQVQYMGTWNALTNTPTLNPLVPEEKGHYYVVSVAGVFGGVDYAVGDWIISNGLIWEKVDNTDAVTSVFGRIGAILALEADYQSFYPRLSQAYDNPTWINTLAFSKITGVPPFLLENQTITLSGDVTGSGKTSISTTISDNAVTDSKLRNSVGTSVIGRASSTTGDPADIQATTDGHVLLRSGGNLLFGLISSDSIGSIDWSKITNTPTTLSGYGITDTYTKTEADNKFVPYTGANANVNLGSNNITANSFIKAGGTSAQFLKADGSVDTSQYVPTTRSINAGTGLTGGGNLSSDVNIAFDTTWGDTRYAYRTRQLTINGTTYDLSADRIWNVGTVTSVGLSMPPAFTVSNSPVIGAGVLTVVGAGTILEYVRGDGSLATFPSLTGYVPYTGATQDVNLGTYGLIGDFVQFNTTTTNIPSAEGVMSWDNTDGTVRLSVKGNIYSVPIGQSVISRVRNNTDVNLLRTNYQVVKISGAQGQRLAVSLAQANNDLNSASTLGLVCENISKNQDGFIINIGQIVNVNTTGNLQGETWLDGDVLYLSPTIAGAITNIKPVAPQHTVILGYVEYAHANNGKIYVKIDNGYELEELHDVSAEPFVNNGLLYRDTTLNLWKSATISTILGYTPAPQGNYITSLTGEATASGPGAASVTLSNSAVTGKVLTGLNIAGNEILSTDSILTAFGKLQHQVNQLVGGLQYEGTWNASTNTPTITSSVGTDGTFYIVSVAGTTNINGITDWQVGDWIVFHDTAWQKVDNSDSVSSVFGRVGNIVANQADYSAFYPLIADIKNGVLTVQGTGVLSGSGTFSANQATNNTITLTHSSVSRADTTSTQTPSFGGSFNVIDSITSSAEGHITAIDTKTVTIPSTVATSTQTGLLSSADWITFNGKQNVITLTTTGTSGPATLVGATLNIPNYAPDLSGYVTLGTDQTVTGLKTIVRSGDVLNFKIGTDTLYGLKLFYSQNELVPSGEATWSFVNTFNRNGVGYETTPISFFRGVLVTGERLLSASINSNLLDYYGNNPSGRYPVYAYNTGVQQFSTGIIVGKTTGVVNAGTGAIADLPAGVVANFNGRVIGGNAVNSNEFVTLSQLGSYVPTSRTLTINGVTFDLSANRSWTITAGVSSVTATSPLFSSGGATPNITIQQASGSQSGFLSSTDWTTFNNKANANGSNASGTWGINITGNATYALNSTRLYASDAPYTYGGSSPYYMSMTYDGTRWLLQVTPGTPSAVRVAYSDSSGSAGSASSVPWSGVTSKPSYLMYYQGFTLDANTMDTNATGFTYAVNAPFVGPIARISANSGYDMWINSPYSGGGTGFAFRTRNGDNGTINPWRYPAIYGVNINGGGELYATSYYDHNNTAYYVDPASASRMNSITYDNLYFSGDTSYGFLGRNVYADTVNGRGSDPLELNYYDGGDVHIGAGASKALRAGTVYSTIFYDSNNTAYYVDPNGTSVITSLFLNGTITVNSGNAQFWQAANGAYQRVDSRNEGTAARSHWYGVLSDGSTSNFRHSWYDGSAYFDIVATGGFINFTRSGGGAITTDGSLRAPIFYDSDNTGRYLDPASSSYLSTVYVDNWFRAQGNVGVYWENWDTRIFSDSSGYLKTRSDNGIVIYDRSGGLKGYLYHDGSGFGLLNNQGGWSVRASYGSSYGGELTGSWTSNGDHRAPIFYDSNNTGFYGDFASTSKLSTLNVNNLNSGNIINVGYTNNGNESVATTSARGIEFHNPGNTSYWIGKRAGTWTQPMDVSFYTGIRYHAELSYNGHRFFVNGYDSTEAFSVGNGDANVRVANSIFVSGDSRAPIFYDISDTGYYLNLNGGSYLYSLVLSGNSYFRPQTWLQFDGDYGLYWPNNYGGHFGPNNTSSHTQLKLQGFKNSYGGLYDQYSAVNGIMYDSGGNGGVYREANGRWYFYYNLGNDCMGIGTSGTSSTYSLYLNKGVYAQSRIDATIYYDSANTAYYLDPSSGSYLASSLEIANGYFLTNGVGGSMYMTAVSGSFGGYLRTSGHMVLDQINAGYNVYVLDGNSVGVVKNAGSQSWSAFSDATIKTVHSTMEDNLSKLESITPIYYSFNNFADDKNRIGLIAQEVQEHFPELVEVEPRTEKLTLDYTGLIPVLLGAIKELKTEIETLKTKQ